MIPADEIAVRVSRARAAMADVGADVLLVDHAELLAWLTGYTVSETMYRAAFLPLADEPWFVLRELDAEPCRRGTWFPDVVGYPDTASPHQAIAASLIARGFGAARIGADFGSYGFTAATHRRLARLLPDATFVDMEGVSDTLRLLKGRSEIAHLEAAARIADAAMMALAEAAEPGLRPRDLGALAAATFLRLGADSGETGPIVVGRGDNEFLHGRMGEDKLRLGDVLHVELIPKVEGYSARLMRPIAIGEVPAHLEAAARALVALQDRQIRAMKPGAAARDVDAILRNGAIHQGLRSHFDNVTGYTLGLYARTPRPSDFSRVLLPSADWMLESGMVLHVYASARGLGFSETVLVASSGPRKLTNSPRSLMGQTYRDGSHPLSCGIRV